MQLAMQLFMKKHRNLFLKCGRLDYILNIIENCVIYSRLTTADKRLVPFA
jgi:malate synthase